MVQVSISQAWDETKAIVARDGRLFGSIALALIALPSAISGLVAPEGPLSKPAPAPWVSVVFIAAFVIALAGQLALVRLAIGPSTTVREAIQHGLRRMPVYLLSAVLVGLAMVLAAIPFAVALAVSGVPLEGQSVPMTPAALLLGFLFVALFVFVFVRMLMSLPAASAESIGPVEIIKRSWHMTAGHWWVLFGFFLIYLIAQIVLQLAVGATVGLVAIMLLGRPEPLSVSALVLALAQALVNAGLMVIFSVMLARIYLQLSGQSQAEPFR